LELRFYQTQDEEGEMSRQALHELVDKAIGDKRFRQRLVANPDKALSGFDLDPEERAAAYRLRDALSSAKDPLDLATFLHSGPGGATPMGKWI
jgi:hypothetical protein